MATAGGENINSLHLTSTGVGHAYQHPRHQPRLKWRHVNGLPPSLSFGQPLRVDHVYQSTAQAQQRSCDILTTPPPPPPFKRAAGNWKVQYNLDTFHKLNAKPWRRPLTMATQTSEMKAEFQGRPDFIVVPGSTHILPQPPTLRDHINDGPTKGLPASTLNPAAHKRPFMAGDEGVLDILQPYLSTHSKDHRYFRPGDLFHHPQEQRHVPATFWQCEDYPKARGFGSVRNPLDLEACPPPEAIMRDRTIFRRSTKHGPLHQPQHIIKPINDSLQSSYTDGYAPPFSRHPFCSGVPPTAPVIRDKSLLHLVPHMYKSINTIYGSP